MSWRGRLEFAACFAVGAWFCVWAGHFIYETSFVALDGERRFCLFDDSMISMRYALNLAEGHGLVWNSGERVEGFTNMLMTLFMSACIAVFGKFDGVLAVQVGGLLFMLGVATFTALSGRLVVERLVPGAGRWLSVSFFACALAYYPLAYWSLMGMETGLVTMLISAGLWRALAVDGETRVAWSLPVLLGLAFWTRPDTSWAAALIMLYRLVGIAGHEGGRKTIVVESAVLAGFVAAISLFRLAYYGSIVPNTYVLKMTGLDLAFRLENAKGYLGIFFETGLVPMVVAGVCAVCALSRPTILLAALVLGSFGYQIYVGGDPWLYWRMLAPYMPLALALTILGPVGLWRWARVAARRLDKRSARLDVVVGALAIVAALGTTAWSARRLNTAFEEEAMLEKKPYLAVANRTMTNTGLALAEVTKPGASVGVLWAGSIPYFSGRRAVDFLGKTDPHIARVAPDTRGGVAWRGMKSVPGHNKYDLQHSIVELMPTYIQAYKWGRQSVSKFARRNYRFVRYKGVNLPLLRDSVDVDWEKLERR